MVIHICIKINIITSLYQTRLTNPYPGMCHSQKTPLLSKMLTTPFGNEVNPITRHGMCTEYETNFLNQLKNGSNINETLLEHNYHLNLIESTLGKHRRPKIPSSVCYTTSSVFMQILRLSVTQRSIV